MKILSERSKWFIFFLCYHDRQWSSYRNM